MAQNTVVVLAGNADGTHRAGSFTGEALNAGVAAAHQQGLAVVRPTTDELLAEVRAVPPGRLSSAGKVVCSFVKRETYDKFAALIGTENEVRPASAGDASAPPAKPIAPSPAQPQPPVDLWASITVGAVVLAHEGRDDGWWEAVVRDADPVGEKLVLSWRDWPNLPRFTALRRSVALTAPKS